MTIVIDNCLPWSWVEFFRQQGYEAKHWREIGAANAPDLEIMRWAFENQAIILSQDLDFTKLLFQSAASLPSVIQLRLDDVRPQNVGEDIIQILRQYQTELKTGVLVTLKGHKSRLRILPLTN